MTMQSIPSRVASVVLNYNSDADVMVSAPQLLAQEYAAHDLIIVDNASAPACVQRLQAWLTALRPDAVIGSPAEVEAYVKSHCQSGAVGTRVFLVLNDRNQGYSAGNNIGIRLADMLGAKAVLIANPDMRIDNRQYITGLTAVAFASDRHCIAASRILGLDGKDQSPLREPGFGEELLGPLQPITRLFKKTEPYILDIAAPEPVPVPKVPGCCLMLRMDFLKAMNYLDENTFLYCEEPILSAQVRRYKGYNIFVPTLSAVHAHQKSEKGNASRRMLLFINSRKYYLTTYSNYGLLKRSLLFFSYWVLTLSHRIKAHRGN